MFLQSGNYMAALESLMVASPSIDMAVAFWGRGAENIFKNTTHARIVCNLLSGGTNPEVIENLLKIDGFVLKHHDCLHAKVVVGLDQAIVGSANMSTNGLNIEAGEFDGWEEAGMKVNDPESLLQIRAWFENTWDSGIEILQDSPLLEQARVNWKRRDTARIRRQSNASSVLNMPDSELRNSNIYLALWSEEVSPEAQQEVEKRTDSLRETAGDPSIPVPYYFEGWTDERCRMKCDQIVISIYIGKRGKVRVDGVFRINEELRISNGELLHICDRQDLRMLMGKPFAKAERKRLEEKVNGLKTQLKPGSDSVLIPLEQFIAKIRAE